MRESIRRPLPGRVVFGHRSPHNRKRNRAGLPPRTWLNVTLEFCELRVIVPGRRENGHLLLRLDIQGRARAHGGKDADDQDNDASTKTVVAKSAVGTDEELFHH